MKRHLPKNSINNDYKKKPTNTAGAIHPITNVKNSAKALVMESIKLFPQKGDLRQIGCSVIMIMMLLTGSMVAFGNSE
jgi:hypothetical protein